MKIGISTAVKTRGENWDRLNDLIDLNFKHIELYNKITRIRLIDVAPLREFKKRKKITFSFHSMVQDLFGTDKIIAQAELNCLRGEIQLASLIGCNSVIFHISKKTILTSREIKNLNLLTQFAQNRHLKLCLENNFSTGVFSGDYLAKAVNQVKNLHLCLDLGHLNIAINKGLINNLPKFLNAIKKRVSQLHLNFNNGKQDQHSAPREKNLDFFKKIFKIMKSNNPLLLIETKNINQAVKINKFIKKYV